MKSEVPDNLVFLILGGAYKAPESHLGTSGSSAQVRRL